MTGLNGVHKVQKNVMPLMVYIMQLSGHHANANHLSPRQAVRIRWQALYGDQTVLLG